MSDPTTTQSPDAKILADLSALEEKMNLCDMLLQPTADAPAPNLENDPELLAVIGFLEACKPRMVELVEVAATGGVLQEEALVKSLEMNDRLTKTLEDIDTYAMTQTPASTTAAAAPNPQATMNDLLLNADTSAPAIGPSKSEDEFDDFFSQRTSGQS